MSGDSRWWTVTWFNAKDNTEHKAEYYGKDKADVYEQFYATENWTVHKSVLKIERSFL